MKYSGLKVKAIRLLWSIDREISDEKNRGRFSAEDIAEITGVNKSTVWMIAKNHRRNYSRRE